VLLRAWAGRWYLTPIQDMLPY